MRRGMSSIVGCLERQDRSTIADGHDDEVGDV